MPKSFAVTPSVVVPGDAWSWRATRASGPGGQNVNKVSSRVEVRVDLGRIEGLRADALARLRVLTRLRTDARGRLLVTSQLTRDQPRNLEDAVEKVKRLVAAALVPPRPRRPTRATAGSVERRLDAKRRDRLRKDQRGRVGPDSD